VDGAALTRIAERASGRYSLLLAGFRDGLERVIGSHSPGTDRARRRLREEVYGYARVYLGEEVPMLREEILAIGLGGMEATDAAIGGVTRQGRGDDIDAHLAELAADLETALRLQIERDVSLTMRALRDTALAGAIGKRLGPSRGARGGAAASRRAALSGLVFEFVDRGGRRWPSPRHVRVLWRQALVLAWNETALLRMAELGIAAAEVNHPDPQHGETGRRFAVADGGFWQELRSEVFHPNSNAWLIPVTQS
jgi:hypothetical protein